ncbi:hypothetical protein GIB67_036633 [Kingdonia uniflora]|uniref:Cation/H+ exchanger domain-containing protein n=1 Tax=Kingdonia uniflora TaxID=39325 RepID=A0A7J7LWI0_9MAGN|nr:hypothetical protein GIB67_036633 [Kingdonia uniflora]
MSGGILMPDMTPEDNGTTLLYNLTTRTIVCHRFVSENHRGVFHKENPLQSLSSLFMLYILMVVLLTRTLQFLLKPLKQPRIVCEIIAGIIIGPSVLGRNEKFASMIFPERSYDLLAITAKIGIMYYLFIISVQMDPFVLHKIPRKVSVISIFSVLLPVGVTYTVDYLLKKSMFGKKENFYIVSGSASNFSMASFVVLQPILREFKILNSDVGRLAMQTAMISDVANWLFLRFFCQWYALDPREGLNAIIFYVAMVVFILFVRVSFVQYLRWIISKTPKGKDVDEFYVIMILLLVLVTGFFTDYMGISVTDGPVILGLYIPDGPPLGATLVKRSETIINDVLMPLLFAYIGMKTDLFAAFAPASLNFAWSVFIIHFSAYLAKFLGTLLITPFYMSFRESVSLSLIMLFRGQTELTLYLYTWEAKLITNECLSLDVLYTMMITAIAAPLVNLIYKPTRQYIIETRRTIEHSRPNSEVHIVTCIYNQEGVPSVINLLQATAATEDSPITVYMLHLVELIGRAAPKLIFHDKHRRCARYDSSEAIVSAFKRFEASCDHVQVHSYTSVSPYITMHHDICELALQNRASLIIVLFHKHGVQVDHALYMNNSNVLAHAPCSVGILVEQVSQPHTVYSNSLGSINSVAVLFMGGADAREALAYADRMTHKPRMNLTLVHFVDNGVEDDPSERVLDSDYIKCFREKHGRNDNIIFKEVVSNNGEETINAIQDMRDERYNVFIVGRGQGINSKLIEGLSIWSENPQLGVIGDFISSTDFNSSASVLVVHQHVVITAASIKHTMGIPDDIVIHRDFLC